MDQTPADTSVAREWLVALAAFALTVAAALIGNWQAADIVWGMWVSSITTGYAMILFIIGVGVVRGSNLLRGSAGVDERAALPVLLVGAVFMLAFFSVHFLMFHFGHAMFTQMFFPLPALGEPGKLPGLDRVVAVTLAAYWPVVLASLATRGEGFRMALEGNPAKAISLPYRYVVKNHVMIFIVAGMSAAGLSAYLLYALFLWYFFPFELLKRAAPA